MRKWAALGAVAVMAYAGGHAADTAGGKPAAVRAVAYAREQLGKPYMWAGTGPDKFDCSGLVQQAYAHAGIRIARRSQDQWATEPHVTDPQPGDLAFFAGADGTMTSPGHVGLVIGHGKMIEAYATGYPIRVASWHRADLVGFTDPAAGGSR